MKRSRANEELESELEEVAREIEKTSSEIDKTLKDIEEKEAAEGELRPLARTILKELRDVQAQLANPALSEEEKAALREVRQQQLAEQQCLGKDLDAVNSALQHLRKREEQLRDEKRQLRDKEKELRQSSAKAAGAEQERSHFQLQQQLEALPYPSELADNKEWSKEGNLAFFRCFRPTAGVGPTKALPVALYAKVLDDLVGRFDAALQGRGSGGADGVPPSNADCKMANRLCLAMAESFTDEAARMVAFTNMLNEYLGERIEPHHPIPGSKYETDGSLLFRVGGPASSAAWLPVYIQQVKLEIGTKGDPYFQGLRNHQLYVTNPALAALVRHTVLPVLYVELVGPHLRVSALASPADATVVCEPLTPYLHLFSMQRYKPDHMIRLALVLRAVKDSIGLLKDACRLLQPTAASPAASASAPAALASAAGPAPGASSSPAASAGGEVSATAMRRGVVPLRDPALQLPYPLRPGTGFTDVQPIGAGVYNPLYFAMYKMPPPPPPLLPAAAEVPQHGAFPAASAAASDPVAVAVKFTRMSADAVRVHRAWAAAGLAPQVLLDEVLPCGLTMLVMEQLAPDDGWVMFYSLPPHRKRQLHGAVVAALDRAHAVVVDAERGLMGVHADLRQANVMVQLPREDAVAGAARSGIGGGGGAGVGSGQGGGGGEDAAASGGSSGSRSELQVQVRFVDFDWSGLQGHTRLPAFSRQRLPGYGCGCEVTQEYDRALWEHERLQGPM